VNDPHFWSRHIFVLILPDAIVRGVHAELVARLAAERFPAVAARLALIDSDRVDELFADLIAGSWQTWRYRMIDDLFALGPTLALICRYDGDAADPHLVISAKKGHQHPHLTQPGELRHDFGAINGILGVIHASDSPGEAQRDATVLGLTEADAAAQQAGITDRLRLFCALTNPTSPETRDFDAVLGEVRADIVMAFWDKLSADGKIAELAILTKGNGPDSLAAASTAARLLELCRGSLPQDALDLLACDFTPSTRHGRRAADQFATLRRCGIALDRWQRLVLESSYYFEPARRQW
jgi:nucleoside diphosphate kinase